MKIYKCNEGIIDYLKNSKLQSIELLNDIRYSNKDSKLFIDVTYFWQNAPKCLKNGSKQYIRFNHLLSKAVQSREENIQECLLPLKNTFSFYSCYLTHHRVMNRMISRIKNFDLEKCFGLIFCWKLFYLRCISFGHIKIQGQIAAKPNYASWYKSKLHLLIQCR